MKLALASLLLIAAPAAAQTSAPPVAAPQPVAASPVWDPAAQYIAAGQDEPPGDGDP